MNPVKKCDCGAICAYSIAVIGSFFIVACLVWVMYAYTRPEPLSEDRAAVRRKTLAEVRQADSDALDSGTYAWQNQANHIVRLPIKDALDLSLRLWQNPVLARSNLLERQKQASYVPPPPKNKFD